MEVELQRVGGVNENFWPHAGHGGKMFGGYYGGDGASEMRRVGKFVVFSFGG